MLSNLHLFVLLTTVGLSDGPKDEGQKREAQDERTPPGAASSETNLSYLRGTELSCLLHRHMLARMTGIVLAS